MAWQKRSVVTIGDGWRQVSSVICSELFTLPELNLKPTGSWMQRTSRFTVTAQTQKDAKRHRRVATRYDKLGSTYLGFVQLASICAILGEN